MTLEEARELSAVIALYCSENKLMYKVQYFIGIVYTAPSPSATDRQ